METNYAQRIFDAAHGAADDAYSIAMRSAWDAYEASDWMDEEAYEAAATVAEREHSRAISAAHDARCPPQRLVDGHWTTDVGQACAKISTLPIHWHN